MSLSGHSVNYIFQSGHNVKYLSPSGHIVKYISQSGHNVKDISLSGHNVKYIPKLKSTENRGIEEAFLWDENSDAGSMLGHYWRCMP